MTNKIMKITLIVLMLLGVCFSISNFISEPTSAKMKEEQLHTWEIDGILFINCAGDGQGCYTVYPMPGQ